MTSSRSSSNGAPGTGKSYISELLARYLGAALPKEGDPYVRVQFHPSYDYTDFVEGLRPVQTDDGNRFVKLDGTFKAFCRKVVEENQRPKNRVRDVRYFFLIDEIDRADLSKVFGELMFCLEADKRGPRHSVKTQYQNLPAYDLETKKELAKEEDVFAGGFYIPENVCIIGTMNDIDRSVESMDFALRRRFEFMEIVMPDGTAGERGIEPLKKALRALGFGGNADQLADCVKGINDKIRTEGERYGLNRHYYISQGQFAHLPEDQDRAGDLAEIKKYVWKFRVEPLLWEYLRGENEEEVRKFVEACRMAGGFPEDDTQ